MTDAGALSRRALLQTTAAASALLALANFDHGLAQSGSPVPTGGTLRAAFTGAGAQESLDPADVSSNLAWIRLNALYDSLVGIENGEIVNVLAETIAPNDDGSVWTVTVRPGVVFHDGAPLTAEDIHFTFTAHPSPFARAYFPTLNNIDVENSKVIDDRTVEIALLAPDPSFLNTVWAVFIIKNSTTEISDQAVGTGSFMLESFTPGDRSVLVRFDRSWRPADQQPSIDQLELIMINDSSARFNALLAGQIDLAGGLNPADAIQLQDQEGFHLLDVQGGVRYSPGFVMRVDQPPFDNPDVRRAVKMAIDRQQILETIAFGLGEIAPDLFVQGGLYSDPTVDPLPYDPDGARALLEAAGATGTAIPLLTAPIDSGFVELATLVAAQLGAVGLDVSLDVQPAETFWTNLGTLADAQFKAMVSGTASYLEFAAFSYLPDGVFNLSGYNNPDATALIQAATATTSEDERRAFLFDLQALLVDDGPDLVPLVIDSLHGLRDGVEGISTTVMTQYPTFQSARLTS